MSVAEVPVESAVVIRARTGRQVGAVTRSFALVIDLLLLNAVSIIVGLGVALVVSVFPIPRTHQDLWQVVGGAVYVLWYALYFIVFFSTTGQTPGARMLQIRLVTPGPERVKPTRATIRWIGMQLAMLPLFLGYAPILFGRRPLPDWLARTRVVDAPQASVAEARQAARQAAARKAG